VPGIILDKIEFKRGKGGGGVHVSETDQQTAKWRGRDRGCCAADLEPRKMSLHHGCFDGLSWSHAELSADAGMQHTQ